MGTRAIPPFLQKLSALVETCPPEIGAWNEEGDHFIVKSSAFADVLATQYKGSLQTFIRQLHFYSFHKNDTSNGQWTFSHPHFLRGRPDLLTLIERKSNANSTAAVAAVAAAAAVRRGNAAGGNPLVLAMSPPPPPPSYSANSGGCCDGDSASLERRMQQMEHKFSSRLAQLESQVSMLTAKLQAQQSLNGSKDLAGLDEIHEVIARDEERAKKFQRLDNGSAPTTVEESMSVASNNQLMSLNDLLEDLDAYFPDMPPDATAAPPETAGESSAPNTPMATVSAYHVAADTTEECRERFSGLKELLPVAPGTNMELLRKVIHAMQSACCAREEDGTQATFPAMVEQCKTHPHPRLLPPVEQCPMCIELLPYLRRRVNMPDVTDLQIMRATRQVYELCYAKKMKTSSTPTLSPAAGAGDGTD